MRSQEYVFNIEQQTTENGLVQLSASTICQDNKGFIWIGSKYGLNRYDGYSYKLFTKEENGLRENLINGSILIDDNENLWLSYHDEERNTLCDIFNPYTEQAIPLETYIPNLPFDPNELSDIDKIDSHNIIWLQTKTGALYFYKDNQFEKVADETPPDIRGLLIDRDNNIWVASLFSKVLCIKPSQKLIETTTTPFRIQSIWLGKDNQIYIVAQYETLGKQQYPSEPLIWKKNKYDSTIEPLRINLPKIKSKFYPQAFLGKNGFWYIYRAGEILVYTYEGKQLHNFHTTLGKTIHGNLSTYLDMDNSIWFTTPNSIIKTSTRQKQFRYVHSATVPSDYRGITEDDEGNIYFLSNALYKWNPPLDTVYKMSDFRGTYNLIYHDSTIWASIYNAHILGHQLDLKSNAITKYPSPNAAYAFSILATDKHQKYLVGHFGGISYLDLEQKKVLAFKAYNEYEQLKSLYVYHLHRNNTGIWLATNAGIFLMTEQEGIIKHFDKASGHLPFDYIQHINEDNTGVFWLASKGGGLIRWEPELDDNKTSQYQQFTTKNGLSNNYLYAVYVDDDNRLWIPSDGGLMQMDMSTHQVHTYTTKDGLLHNEFNLTSHYRSENGQLYFGGLGGLITFHPDHILRDSLYDAPIEISSCELLKDEDSEMTNQMHNLLITGEIVMAPSDKLLELTFALLDYEGRDLHRYAYKIEGHQDFWHDIQENFLRITHLPYGVYTIKIKGQNINKGWSKHELSIKLRVLRPFYLQWWFISSISLGLICLIVIATKWRIVRLEKQKRILEEEVAKRTQKIEEDKQIIASQAEALKELDKTKTKFFSNITHEFRTPLTLIIGPLEQLLQDQPPQNIYKRRIKGILNNANHLLTLINQMLDLSKLESGQMKLELTRGDIVEYTEKLIQGFEPVIEAKKLRFQFISSPNSWTTHFDKDKWDKIIYNLLSNALKFTPKGENIQLSLIKTSLKGKEAIRLDLKDTGVGIEYGHLNHIFNRFYQADDSTKRTQGGTGIGLALVKELVELQGGEIWVSSMVDKGTSFEVYLPIPKVTIELPNNELEVLSVPIIEDYNNILTKPSHPSIQKKSGKLELLIIEDNQEMREYIQSCIDTSKYNITEASNGEEGVLKAQAIIPDLIISDVMMPLKDGYEVVQDIREHTATSHIPIILLTAKASLESRLEALDRGADVYLTKPFSPHELALRIQKSIEIRQLLQKRYSGTSPSRLDEEYNKEDEFILQLKAYITANIDQSKLGGDEIGQHFGMSRVHLYRKLKALTNQSISTFVLQIRLENAKELILKREMNISEIAYQSGFSSVSYFSRSFKKTYGISPSEM